MCNTVIGVDTHTKVTMLISFYNFFIKNNLDLTYE